ncbi:MAG: 4-hydroxy-tetrahydrodipicolinate synthase [Methylacidiphilales bacterium]|nr:4-hydroxy-tetrahydrodipicolinate synthase [Candidatus Methylacidiphilales bacterium]
MSIQFISGSIVALVTPMHEDGSVDYESLLQLLEFHKVSGTSAVVMVGTTGESATLEFDEHIEVIKYCVRAKKIPIIAGCGANSTAEAVALTKAVASEQILATLSVTPYYNKPTQQGMIMHYTAVADASEVPLILYNVPSRTGVDLLPETVVTLANHPHIVGLKEAIGDMARIDTLRRTLPNDFSIVSGDDATFLDCLQHGGNGVISVSANVVPNIIAEICKLWFAGQHQQARVLDSTLASLHKDLFVESNPIPVKWALYKMKKIKNYLRLPLTPLSEKYFSAVSSALKQAGVPE